jgi:hypothetical protein
LTSLHVSGAPMATTVCVAKYIFTGL